MTRRYRWSRRNPYSKAERGLLLCRRRAKSRINCTTLSSKLQAASAARKSPPSPSCATSRVKSARPAPKGPFRCTSTPVSPARRTKATITTPGGSARRNGRPAASAALTPPSSFAAASSSSTAVSASTATATLAATADAATAIVTFVSVADLYRQRDFLIRISPKFVTFPLYFDFSSLPGISI